MKNKPDAVTMQKQVSASQDPDPPTCPQVQKRKSVNPKPSYGITLFLAICRNPPSPPLVHISFCFLVFYKVLFVFASV